MRITSHVVVLALAAAALAGCRPETTPEAHDRPAAMPAMPMEPGMMQRHAADADSAVDEVRRHVDLMRGLPPLDWHDRMTDHVRTVGGMVSMMERQVREMDMGMGMDDAQMGAMMGKSPDEYRRMHDEMRAVRGELEHLQTAPAIEVREHMLPHLDRVERLARLFGRSAEHMREN